MSFYFSSCLTFTLKAAMDNERKWKNTSEVGHYFNKAEVDHNVRQVCAVKNSTATSSIQNLISTFFGHLKCYSYFEDLQMMVTCVAECKFQKINSNKSLSTFCALRSYTTVHYLIVLNMNHLKHW